MGHDLYLAGLIQAVHPYEGFRHRLADGQQAVGAHDHGFVVRAQALRQAVLFGKVMLAGGALEFMVGKAVVETQGEQADGQ